MGMTADVSPPDSGSTLSDIVADEIAAELGRQRMSQRQLAAKLGVSAPWVSDRLAGKTSISVDDLAVIAAGLRRPIAHFLPRSIADVGPEPEARSAPMRTRPSHARRRGTLATHEYGPMAERVAEKVTLSGHGPGSRKPRDSRPKGRPDRAVPAPTLRRPVRIGSAAAPE